MIRSAAVLSGFAAVLLAVPYSALSVPLLGSGRDAGGIRVYSDDKSATTFYYAPRTLTIASGKDDLPEISFLQMRYMGTSVSGDKGDFRTLSILSFKVKMSETSDTELAAARTLLRSEGSRVYHLKPLPIRKVEAVLNYVPLKDTKQPPAPDQPPGDGQTSGKGENPRKVGSGSLENIEGVKQGSGYWSERVFTISPDDVTSQALWDAFQTGKVMLSLSYAFYADGIAPEKEKPKVEGNVSVPSEPQAASPVQPEEDPRVILADTIEVVVDAKLYPERFKKIDINESVPANYAALAIYCYDFNNSLRPDLYEKVVEVEAASVTGKPIIREVSFSKSSPDVYSASVRFPFAVSLKHPYRYRIREVSTSGESKVKPWRQGNPWSQQLDVTTPPEEQPAPAESQDSGGSL